MNKKLVFGGAIPIILIFAYLDMLLLGLTSWTNYIYICAWEYCIFWVGFWYGEKLLLKKQKEEARG